MIQRDYQIELKEINGHKIINGKYQNGVLIIVTEKQGQYFKSQFKFNDSYDLYSYDVINNPNDYDVNFIILDNGTMISVNNDGNVSLQHKNINNAMCKIMQDPIFDGNQLFKINNNVYYAQDNKLFSVKMK